ncbi:MAG: sodium-dependent transporter [Planctomycetes bacterium]|nr:sodium-dependent transporter [Planctomycetota bacterium]
MTKQPTQQWGSRLGVILAVAGSAVGLGNFLRFPGQAAQNGGGAFMIPYFLALLLLGIPIGWAEWAMGRYGGRKGFHGAPAILGVWCKGAWGRYAGVLGVLIPLGVYFYYVLIESWCLYYVIQYLGGGLGVDGAAPIADQVTKTQGFFADVTGSAANGSLFHSEGHLLGLHPIVWTFFATAALNIYFVYRGLSKGIETVCKYAMPVMAILGIIILVRVLTLDAPAGTTGQSVNDGLGFLWNPDFEKLTSFKTWLAAAGQIFFSLSVGFGVIINYSSYMRKKDDVVLSGLTSSATNEFFEVVLGGLITVTASVVFVGVALTMEGAKGGTMSLGFKTLPMVFAQMPAGNLFGAAFFLILFLAAITSSLSMLQPTKAFLEESLGVNRQVSTTIVTMWGLAGNIFVLWFTHDLVALDTIDFWVGTFFILVVAGVQIVAFGWIFGVDKGLEEAHQGAHMRIPRVFRFIIKYVSPAFLLVVIVGFCINDLPGYLKTLFGDTENAADSRKTWMFLLLTIAGLVAITAVGARRWRAQGLDLDGKLPAQD